MDVPGHWLGAWAWDAVAADLRGRGHHVTAVTLPGLDPDEPHRASMTVADQAEALRSTVDAAAAAGCSVVLDAYSGAGFPNSVLLDRDSTTVARVVYVDSGPSGNGSVFDASVPPEQDEVPLPPFEQLHASTDGLSEDDLERFRERAVPEPGAVMRDPVRLENDSRRDVPTTIIDCSYPSQVIRGDDADGPRRSPDDGGGGHPARPRACRPHDRALADVESTILFQRRMALHPLRQQRGTGP